MIRIAVSVEKRITYDAYAGNGLHTWSGILRGSKPVTEKEYGMPGSGHLVLCVDDEHVGLQVRRLLLERSGYKVITASDGAAGLKLFQREPVEAVVLDYAMPGMHGGEVATRMRAEKPEVPIVLLSAYVGLPADVTGVVDIYMTKGEGAPALLDKLNSLFA